MTRRPVESIVAGAPFTENGVARRIVVTFEDGSTEHKIGTLFDASQLASDHGLEVIPTPDESFHWGRLTWDEPPPTGR